MLAFFGEKQSSTRILANQWYTIELVYVYAGGWWSTVSHCNLFAQNCRFDRNNHGKAQALLILLVVSCWSLFLFFLQCPRLVLNFAHQLQLWYWLILFYQQQFSFYNRRSNSSVVTKSLFNPEPPLSRSSALFVVVVVAVVVADGVGGDRATSRRRTRGVCNDRHNWMPLMIQRLRKGKSVGQEGYTFAQTNTLWSNYLHFDDDNDKRDDADE